MMTVHPRFLLCVLLMATTTNAALPPVDLSPKMAHRTNFCMAKATYIANSNKPDGSAMTSSLQGTTINVGVDTNLVNPAMITFDHTSGIPNSGAVFLTFQLLASKMGFTVNYVKLPAQTSLQTNTAYVVANAPYVDIVAPYLSVEDINAMQSKVLMSPPIVVSPTLLISVIPPSVPATLWNFLIPFEFPLWGLLLGTMIATGLFWWLLRDPKQAKDTNAPFADQPSRVMAEEESRGVGLYPETSFVFNIFYSLNTMSGEKAKVDDNNALKLITVTYNFLIVVVVSAYTANLAAVLLASAIPPPPLLDSISSANVKGKVVCMLAGSANVAYTRLNYPRVRILEAPFPTYITNINDGICDGALVYQADWEYYKGLMVTNPTSNLFQIGEPLMSANYVLPFYMDYDTRCTEFLRTTTAYAILNGLAANSFGVAYNETVTKLSELKSPPAGLGSLSLTTSDMGGIFIVYTIFVAFSLVVFVFGWFTANFVKIEKQEGLVTMSLQLRRSNTNLSMTDDTESDPAPRSVDVAVIEDQTYVYEQTPTVLLGQPPRAVVPSTPSQESFFGVSALTPVISLFDAINPTYLVSPSKYTSTVPANSNLPTEYGEREGQWPQMSPVSMYGQGGPPASPPPSTFSQPRGQVTYPGGGSFSSY